MQAGMCSKKYGWSRLGRQTLALLLVVIAVVASGCSQQLASLECTALSDAECRSIAQHAINFSGLNEESYTVTVSRYRLCPNSCPRAVAKFAETIESAGDVTVRSASGKSWHGRVFRLEDGSWQAAPG